MSLDLNRQGGISLPVEISVYERGVDPAAAYVPVVTYGSKAI
jgi:hypothetical protein